MEARRPGPGSGRVILVEFNELCPPLMKRFMGQGLLPNFKRFYDESDVWTTEAPEKPPYLEPWIQWITVHNGVGFDEHKVFNLDEGHNVTAPALWDVLSEAGYRTWVCGSMNPRTSASFDGAILPDPWTTKVAARPAELRPFFSFIQRNVQEYTNDKLPLSKRDYFDFATFMATHGLSRKTALGIAKQLASEKRTKGKTRWKRATILDRLQLDVFRHYWQKLEPHFATFFSNSTAHFQHMHWRNMEPQLFKVAPGEEEQAQYHDAIEYGYRQMDGMLGELMDVAGKDTTLVFLTALSQQPCLLYEEQGGKVAYRPRDFETLLQWAGVESRPTVAPVMTQYFHLVFEDAAAASAAAVKLRALQAAGTHALHVDEDGKTLFCGCRIYKKLEEGLSVESTVTGKTARFFDYFYKIEGMKSGMHHPDGMFWVRSPDRRHAEHSEKLPLGEVAPKILDLFSVTRPPTMRARASVNGKSASASAE